ncbi:hypothetical protein [Bradyrhizobium lablabi]|uniref:hypothetical protein n=1 Tax=Bradyrhizobium lablabi TaxID=722472 RepID=UPI001BACB3C0|nr:hypothetical protein [Bradyrhizobium lablabi]MBR0695974.1 hypothetical protein [Bradyrhizobium lablabi]
MSGKGKVRAVRAVLFGLERNRIIGAVRLAIVGNDEVPELVMLDGEPFLKMPAPAQWESRDVFCYAQTRPFRVDGGLIEAV